MSYDPVIADLNRYLDEQEYGQAVEEYLDAELGRCKSAEEVAELIEEILHYGQGGSLDNKKARAREAARDALIEFAIGHWASSHADQLCAWYDAKMESEHDRY